MIYTCYEMVRDCRAGVPEGWIYFISYYVPAIRRTVAQYAPERAGDAALMQRILLAVRKPESFLFHSTEDQGVPVFNSDLYVASLKAAGIPFKYIRGELGRHGIGLKPF